MRGHNREVYCRCLEHSVYSPMTAITTPSGAAVAGVLAMELMHGGAAPRAALAQDDAGALAAMLGRDLALLCPDAARLDLVLAGAHFDPAEVLRPGWPVHRRLQELHARAPRGEAGRVIGFGSDADGNIPQPLRADAQLAGGALRLLPFVLAGDAAVLPAVAAVLEEVLVDRGMAGADTALALQDGLGTRIEHLRMLTVHDLAAMMALQYEHAGLGPLWPVLETALLNPRAEAWVDAGPEPLLRLVGGQAHVALFLPETWRLHYAIDDADAQRVARRYEAFQARQRQFAAVLDAHGIEVVFDCCAGRDDARAALG